MVRKEGVIVPAKSEADIANAAGLLRSFLQQSQVLMLPIIKVYELLHICFDANARFEVIEDHLMGDDDARTYPEQGLILLRQSVYDGAARGEARPRFTMCHELGHLALHRGVSFSRINQQNPQKIYCNSEWQADIFASHLLMPQTLLAGYTAPQNIASDFGVSLSAAQTRLHKMNKRATKQAS